MLRAILRREVPSLMPEYSDRSQSRIRRRTALRWMLGGSVGAIASTALLACQRTTPAQTPRLTATASGSGATTIRFASNRTLAEVGVYIAAERGYFAEQGLQVSLAEISGRDLSAALASGQVDAAGSPVGASLFNAVARGIPLKIVAPMARQDPGASSTYLMVRKDLIDKRQFTDYASLAGRKIGVAGTPNYILSRTLDHAGLAADAVNAVDLGQDFQAMTVALSTGAIDAASQPEPTATLASESGAAVKWREVSDVAPRLQLTVVLFGPGFIAQRGEVAERWMAAYLKGVRDYHAGIIRNGPGRDEVIATLARWTPVTDPLLYRKMGFPYIDPNGEPNLDSRADQIRFSRDQGIVAQSLQVHDIVDARFAQAAVRRLGRSEP